MPAIHRAPPKPYYDRDGITIYRGDSLRVMRSLPGASVDLVLTDPPYQHAHMSGKGIVRGEQFYGDPFTKRMSEFDPTEFLGECRRLQQKLSIVAFGSRLLIRKYCAALPGSEIDMHVLAKQNPTPFCHRTFLPDLEYVFLLYDRGRPFVSGLGARNYRRFTLREPNQPALFRDRLHPMEKPLPMIRRYASILSLPGQMIFDPYLGSGTTLAAAKMLGRRAIGIERETRFCKIAAERIEKLREGDEIEKREGIRTCA